MVFAKKLETLSFFVFSTTGQKKLSSELVDRKLKKSKTLHFFKLVRPWFLDKNWK